MSDIPQAPGWWLASDGKYYPPQQAPGAYPAPQYSVPYAVQQKVNGLAIAAMVLGIIWIYWIGSVLALVFGYVAKSQIDKSQGRQSGRGMAIAGIVLGWVGVGLFALMLVFLLVASRNTNDF